MSKLNMSRVFTGISVSLNALFAVFMLAASGHKTKSLSFFVDNFRVTAACVVSVEGSASQVVFNPPDISLRSGEAAALQFSVIANGTQFNIAQEALYDHAVIHVEKTGYGLLITALRPGNTVLQTLTSDGIRDVALISVLSAAGSPQLLIQPERGRK